MCRVGVRLRSRGGRQDRDRMRFGVGGKKNSEEILLSWKDEASLRWRNDIKACCQAVGKQREQENGLKGR